MCPKPCLQGSNCMSLAPQVLMQRQWLQQPQPTQQQYRSPQLMQLQMVQGPVHAHPLPIVQVMFMASLRPSLSLTHAC